MTEKTIDTLVEDIYSTLSLGIPDKEIDESALKELGEGIIREVRKALSKEGREERRTLRMSNIGKPCSRQLYYEVNSPEDAEELPPATRLKFLFGHILEELLVYLTLAAGHSVEGRQDEVSIAGVKGHRDGVVDGVLVDFKSASTYSFQKFKDGKLSEDDPFGYLDQIHSYHECAQVDPIVTDKERCGFIVVDKTLGNICLDLHKKRKFPTEAFFEYKKKIVAAPEPPARGFDPVPEGKSGNMKLPLNCSYCPFKNKCYPNLRTFVYAKGPVFLTKVVKEPKVDESFG